MPMLVAIPLLAGDGSLITAIRQSVVKSSIALGAIGLIGRYALNPVFKIVASSKSQVQMTNTILTCSRVTRLPSYSPSLKRLPAYVAY